ncbi:uncharacterized protein SAPINGB_P005766 [Magnusiomyces paraingens]|uniref:Uncharacterized protein n=1 Tax=Magnusiomyces paraingens TaxID=2606893 RepID=A0A5E8C118_9ASCO|nr:uncharacterized protein SAPINGB_P005766 [Saprochaete ingens]VVT57579.1 unnamed protein product [Saprochaete ingens]
MSAIQHDLHNKHHHHHQSLPQPQPLPQHPQANPIFALLQKDAAIIAPRQISTKTTTTTTSSLKDSEISTTTPPSITAITTTPPTFSIASTPTPSLNLSPTLSSSALSSSPALSSYSISSPKTLAPKISNSTINTTAMILPTTNSTATTTTTTPSMVPATSVNNLTSSSSSSSSSPSSSFSTTAAEAEAEAVAAAADPALATTLMATSYISSSSALLSSLSSSASSLAARSPTVPPITKLITSIDSKTLTLPSVSTAALAPSPQQPQHSYSHFKPSTPTMVNLNAPVTAVPTTTTQSHHNTLPGSLLHGSLRESLRESLIHGSPANIDKHAHSYLTASVLESDSSSSDNDDDDDDVLSTSDSDSISDDDIVDEDDDDDDDVSISDDFSDENDHDDDVDEDDDDYDYDNDNDNDGKHVEATTVAAHGHNTSLRPHKHSHLAHVRLPPSTAIRPVGSTNNGKSHVGLANNSHHTLTRRPGLATGPSATSLFAKFSHGHNAATNNHNHPHYIHHHPAAHPRRRSSHSSTTNSGSAAVPSTGLATFTLGNTHKTGARVRISRPGIRHSSGGQHGSHNIHHHASNLNNAAIAGSAISPKCLASSLAKAASSSAAAAAKRGRKSSRTSTSKLQQGPSPTSSLSPAASSRSSSTRSSTKSTSVSSTSLSTTKLKTPLLDLDPTPFMTFCAMCNTQYEPADTPDSDALYCSPKCRRRDSIIAPGAVPVFFTTGVPSPAYSSSSSAYSSLLSSSSSPASASLSPNGSGASPFIYRRASTLLLGPQNQPHLSHPILAARRYTSADALNDLVRGCRCDTCMACDTCQVSRTTTDISPAPPTTPPASLHSTAASPYSSYYWNTPTRQTYQPQVSSAAYLSVPQNQSPATQAQQQQQVSATCNTQQQQQQMHHNTPGCSLVMPYPSTTAPPSRIQSSSSLTASLRALRQPAGASILSSQPNTASNTSFCHNCGGQVVLNADSGLYRGNVHSYSSLALARRPSSSIALSTAIHNQAQSAVNIHQQQLQKLENGTSSGTKTPPQMILAVSAAKSTTSIVMPVHPEPEHHINKFTETGVAGKLSSKSAIHHPGSTAGFATYSIAVPARSYASSSSSCVSNNACAPSSSNTSPLSSFPLTSNSPVLSPTSQFLWKPVAAAQKPLMTSSPLSSGGQNLLQPTATPPCDHFTTSAVKVSRSPAGTTQYFYRAYDALTPESAGPGVGTESGSGNKKKQESFKWRSANDMSPASEALVRALKRGRIVANPPVNEG